MVLLTVQVIAGVGASVITTSGTAVLSMDGQIIIDSIPDVELVERAAASDPDLGPMCSLNRTTNTFSTGLYASYGFIATNADCKADCTRPGCTGYYANVIGSGNYFQLPYCLASEAFHYAKSGERKESFCPYYSLDRTVFEFRGTLYKAQWYWLGWPTDYNCAEAILCGPTSHYFDYSQSSSLTWCQPVPVGFYSPQCDNRLLRCTLPDWAGDGSLGYFTSHGFGRPDGCGYRLAYSATLSGVNTRLVMDSDSFSIGCSFSLYTPPPVGRLGILVGSFSQFYIAIQPTSASSVHFVLFHSRWTIGPSSSVQLSASVDLDFGIDYRLIVTGDGSNISFILNDIVISRDKQVVSTGGLGATNFGNLTNLNFIHFGFVNLNNFINSNNSPYLFQSNLNGRIGNLLVSSGTYVPTVKPVYTSTAQYVWSPPPTQSPTTKSPSTTSTTPRAPAMSSTAETAVSGGGDSILAQPTTTAVPTSTKPPVTNPTSTVVVTAGMTAGIPTTLPLSVGESSSESGPLIGLIIMTILIIISIIFYFLKKFKKLKNPFNRSTPSPPPADYPLTSSWDIPTIDPGGGPFFDYQLEPTVLYDNYYSPADESPVIRF
jgi:hypothetical protein